jgi:carboxyl-terminal processing protease
MKIKRLLIAFIFLLGISCNLVSQVPGTATPLIPITGATAAATSGSSSIYIPPQCAGQPVATLPAATTEALPTPSLGTNPPLTKDQQLKVFDEMTSIIPGVYIYPDFNGLNWPATVASYRAKIEAGVDTQTFYNDMEALIVALGDDHSQFESPAQVTAANAQLSGQNDYAGIGVEIMAIPQRNLLTVLLDFPGSTADHAGLMPHDNILDVDGIPVSQNGVPSPQLVRGPACSAVVLTVQTPGQEPRNVTLLRYNVASYVPIVARLVTTHDGSRIGYIFLPSFFDETIPQQVKQALQQFGHLDGLILDNRENPGGSSVVVEPILSYFTNGLLGHFASRTDSQPFEVSANPVANSQTVPMAILVSKNTASFGEIFSGIMQDIGRAKVVGQTTPGHVELLESHDFSDGSRLWLAQERFVPLNSQADWKKTGIVPDVQAYADWDTFTFENDPVVAAAVKLLGHN